MLGLRLTNSADDGGDSSSSSHQYPADDELGEGVGSADEDPANQEQNVANHEYPLAPNSAKESESNVSSSLM